MSTRTVQKRPGRTRNEGRELLDFFFISELLRRSERVWIVSPWLRNFALFDNRAGGYGALLPEAARKEIRLVDVLRELLIRGSHVTVVTRPPPDGGGVPETLREMAAELGCPGRAVVLQRLEVHSKGIVGARAAIIGSMNFTNSGIDVQTEIVQLTTDARTVGELNMEFAQTYPAVMT